MSRTVLVPFDGSKPSQSALTYAFELFTESDIIALHVIRPFSPTPDTDTESVQQYKRAYENAHDVLAEARAIAKNHSKNITAEYSYGHPINTIVRYTDLYTIDQVVIGDHHQADAAQPFLGTVTEAVVQRSSAPVTVVRPPSTDEALEFPNSILVPFDGSIKACTGLMYAIDQFSEAAITVLYANYPILGDGNRPEVYGDDHTNFQDWYEEIQEWHREADRDPEKVLKSAHTIANQHGVTPQMVTESGEPQRIILEFIENNDVDHVVIGAHTNFGLVGLQLGSVAQFVVRHSPTPVTVVR